MPAAGGRRRQKAAANEASAFKVDEGPVLVDRQSRSTHEASAKAIYFSPLTLLTAAASGRVAARQQSFEASEKAIYFPALTLLMAAAVEVRTKHP